ncbi:MAG TPA: nuclear transport factor 2 family protein [Terriglobales bacterium]|nr:nuclear transport factor 2 family protein [Terriglobales bacterium]
MKTFAGYTVLLAAIVVFGSPIVAAQAVASPGDDGKHSDNEVRTLNEEEVQAFVHNDSKAMERLWSDDMVVTNPLNRFVTKQQVLGMVKSGFLAIPSYDRQIEYVRVYGDVVIVAGSEKYRNHEIRWTSHVDPLFTGSDVSHETTAEREAREHRPKSSFHGTNMCISKMTRQMQRSIEGQIS